MNNFLGEIRLFAGSFAPAGWNFCDGTLLPISTYAALYALIGTTYGGDGSNSFALPDLRGRVPIHQGSVPIIGTYTPGESGGFESVTLTVNQIPAHSHTLIVSSLPGTATDPTNNLIAQTASTCKVFAKKKANTVYNAAHVAQAGKSVPHENRQPFQAINYIIALSGIFPSQN